MSAERRHTDVFELGWLDFLAYCKEDPLVRVEGHDELGTAVAGKLKRFNRVVEIDPSTSTGGSNPTVRAYRTRRTGDELVPTGATVLLQWRELDWVSWLPSLSPDGRRLKLTVTGRSALGGYEIWDERVVERSSGRVVFTAVNRGLAVAYGLRLVRAA